jgi:hypothetical protein
VAHKLDTRNGDRASGVPFIPLREVAGWEHDMQYHHQSPAFSATVEFIFRLEEDHDGYAILSGNIHSARDIQVISRTVHFNYVMKRPGEIEISDMRYAKSPRDTADDDSFRYSFFYVPEGDVRHLRIGPLRNGWLIGNPQSPFALCLNK